VSKPRRGRHKRPGRLPVPDDPRRPWVFAVAEILQHDVARLLRALPLRRGLSDAEFAIEAHALALTVASLNAEAASATATPAEVSRGLREASVALKSAAGALNRLPNPAMVLLGRALWAAYQDECGSAALLLGRLHQDMRHGLPQMRVWLPALAAACARAAQSRPEGDRGEPDQLGDAAAATFRRVTGEPPPKAEAGDLRDLMAGLLELAGFKVEGPGHVSPEKVARGAAERFMR
jgi:hypothetical protein